MKLLRLALLFLAVSIVIGCSTRGRFVIPEGSSLEIYGRPVDVGPDGVVKMRPMGFSARGSPPTGGAGYRLTQDGQVLQKGRLRTVFRGVSIIWPPYGFLFWGFGLNPNITYDLVSGKQE
jgi:hypothetical protein